MSKRKTLLIAVVTVGIVAISWLGFLYKSMSSTKATLEGPANVVADSIPQSVSTDKAILFFQERTMRDARDAVSYTILGQLHMRKARETGDVASYQRAEAALLRALELLPGYTPANASLASVYYAQHMFDKALSLAQQVYENDPKALQALATIGDAHFALGNYDEAEGLYHELARKSPSPAVWARLGQLSYLKGDKGSALQFMQRAADEAVLAGEAREAIAWYQVRLGELYFNLGQLEKAEKRYESALKIFDDYYIALAGLGKLRAAEGRYNEAISIYERAVAIIPQPAILAALGDTYAKVGNHPKAKAQYDTVEFIAKLAALNQLVYNRELSLFYSNHDLNLNEALRLAEKELAIRKDIYGYGALAWALYKNGRFNEAATAITEATRFGTPDPTLYYHAGMIYYELGAKEKAKEYLERALALNPHFSVLHDNIAKKTLQKISMGKSSLTVNSESRR